MFTVEQVIDTRFPQLGTRHRWMRDSLLRFLRLVSHESHFRQFAQDYPDLSGFDFVDKVLEYFAFSYAVRSDERERIPSGGAVVIVANHPIGSLDGLALLQLVHEVRADVRVVANDLLTAIAPLRPLLLPVDVVNGATARGELRNIEQHLAGGGALIMFPAGEVSRLAPQGVRDGRWRSGFLRMARRARAPVVPVHVDARNSLFFYAVSLLARPLSTLLLVREMFRHARSNVAVRIGQPIAPPQYAIAGRSDKWIAKRFRKQVYALGNGRRKQYFDPPARAIAHPENRQLLRHELRAAQPLGRSRDDKSIHLFRYAGDSVVMREIGRLREVAFRAVGEGSGERRDIDRFDAHYEHIVLWDDEDLEIVGAYRMAHAGEVLARSGGPGLYTGSLFIFTAAMQAYWPQAMELGRSFVQPRYWGRRGLDYLWYGIGACVRARPDCRWLFGPVTIPNNYPPFAKDLLVCFYAHYFKPPAELAVARRPYHSGLGALSESELGFAGDDYDADFARLRDALAASGLQIPTLFRRYTEAVQTGGAWFLAFNVDPDFGHCVDGLILLDLNRLRYTYRQRYLGAATAAA